MTLASTRPVRDLGVRQALRHAVEAMAVGGGVSALGRRLARERVAILAYHNVVPVEEAGRGETSLHLALPTFLEQIDRLVETHDVVDLDGVVAGGASGDRPRAVITFDDAYRGSVRLALPELVRRGLPAMVFVSPALLGTPSTWWDELAEAGRLTPENRRHALIELGGRAGAIRAWAFGGDTPPALPESYGIASLDEIRHGVTGDIKVGSHGWAHEHLPSLDPAALMENLVRVVEWLGQFEPRSSSWIALPYGEGSPAVRRAALAAGHVGVLDITGGMWGSDENMAHVPRINVPAGVSLRGLELRTAGVSFRPEFLRLTTGNGGTPGL